MGNHIARRVETAVFPIHLDARQLQGSNTRRGFRRDLMLEVDEVLVTRQFFLDLT